LAEWVALPMLAEWVALPMLAEWVALPMLAEWVALPMLAEWVALPIKKWRTSSIACPDAAVPELLSTRVWALTVILTQFVPVGEATVCRRSHIDLLFSTNSCDESAGKATVEVGRVALPYQYQQLRCVGWQSNG
jgi:hypothetical protein